MNIEVISCNSFQVNTYFIYNETGDLLVIDPGCSNSEEKKIFSDFITSKNLILRKIVLTHGHIDHIIGAGYLQKKFQSPVLAHPDINIFLEDLLDWAKLFGFETPIQPVVETFISETYLIKLKDETFQVIDTPGHAAGSICLINHKHKIVFTGDVLFYESIGRTDLPTGDYDLLIKTIKEKIFTLPDDYVIYPGHGCSTTVGHEKKYNKFFVE